MTATPAALRAQMDSGASLHDGFREERARTSRFVNPRALKQLSMRRSRQSKNERRRRFEQFEQRLLMAADVGADVPDVDQLVQESAPLSTEISADSDNSNRHGFDGSGQTIAVIDSGIAWDHAALGGGYGYGNKVVGGWDFAENDANPYDDGPAGFHGTHVAGIAAGNGDGYQGVAHGADLVGLRVFNDAGIGRIEWVESALQWVRDNLDSFRNPITTVNMSLGADWATESVEDWSVIGDELEALKNEGVFISVAAGNDFEDFFSKTLSYPAANENVVAVSSHDANNQLSSFSQRDDHVLVAPGENVQSTVPDHLFGTRKSDQLLGASGTSMAAPYVAGASAILRQAYAAMGYSEVDQDILYETFWNTSNEIYDAITQTTFRQLDLDAAVASIMDGAIANSGVTRIGTITGSESIRGSIGVAGQSNFYEFTAAASGQIELTFEATDQLSPFLEVTGIAGQTINLQFEGERVYINVEAGQTYKMEVGSLDNSTGHYNVTTEFQQTSRTTDLGTVSSTEVSNFISGERTYSLTASRTGPMAVGFATENHVGTIEVYDAMMNRITSQQVQDGQVGFQFDVSEGEQFFVLLKTNGDATLSVNNLVSVADGSIVVEGTDRADSFVVSQNSTLQIELNGILYSFEDVDFSSVIIRGDATMDALQLNLGERYERTVLRQNRVDSFDGGRTFRAIGFRTMDVFGSGLLTVAGSEGNDTISASYESATISDANSRSTAFGFDKVIADGKGGHDAVHLEGGDENDIFFSKDNYSVIRGSDMRLIAINYENLSVDSRGGYDIANMFGSEDQDQFTMGAESFQVSNSTAAVTGTGFERTTSFAGQSNDAVVFSDSEGNDRFLFSDGTTQLVTESTHHVAHQFRDITVNSTNGYDVAQISGTDGNDQLEATPEKTTFVSDAATIRMNNFNRINVVANFRGYNTASILGSDGNDQFIADSNSASAIFADGAIVRTVGFGDVSFTGAGGTDVSHYNGSTNADVLEVNNERTILRAGRVTAVAYETSSTHFDGRGGGDAVFADEVNTLDVVASMGDLAIAVLEHHRLEAEGFAQLEAAAIDGAIATYDMERVEFQAILRGQWQQK